MVDDIYRGRLDALKHTWQVWVELGHDLTGSSVQTYPLPWLGVACV
ncbi:MAG: hypothetical protein M3460_21530 [Actinomycetota bacterium]|nr:hypothetical protein [Actinomycetota bacterium]